MSTERSGPLKRLWSNATRRSPVPHSPALGSSIIAAVLAVGLVLGLVAVRSNDHTTSGVRPIPPTSMPRSPTTTAGRHVSATEPTAPPTTSIPPPVTSTTAAPSSALCTAADVTVSTKTPDAAYPPGESLEVTTEVTDVTACTFDPIATDDCIVVDESSGGQVWPWPNQGEQCSPPAASVLDPGDVETLQAIWNQQVQSVDGQSEAAPPGSYVAVGTWSWASGGSSPHQAAAASTPFNVS